MSQSIQSVAAADIAASAFLTAVSVDISPLNTHDIPPAEWRYMERTPTDEFLSAPLPGVALRAGEVKRIQIRQEEMGGVAL